MEKLRKVVLCGKSVLLASLEVSLKGRDGLAVTRIDALLSDIEARMNDLLAALGPDVVVIDLGDAYEGVALTILKDHPGIALIGVDPAKNTVLVLSSQKFTTQTTAELADVLQMKPGA